MTDNNITDFGTVEPLKPGAAIKQNAIKQKTGYKSLFERFEEYETDMKATPQTITTGFTTVDEDLKFNGFTMLGGASGAGKTSLCLNIALNRARVGLKTVFYSLEMPVFTLVNRLICKVCEVDYIHAADFWQTFKEKAAKDIKNIFFVGGKDMITGKLPKFDTGEHSELVKTIEQAKEQGAGDVLIIIDSLHLLPADAADVRAATNENVIKIRTLTDTYHVNTLVIGQSKRGEKSFEYITDIWDKKARRHDTAQLRAQFRESALIEYAADALFYLLNAAPGEGSIKWLCAVKNRIADTGVNSDRKIKGLDFDGEHYKFVEKYTEIQCREFAAEDEETENKTSSNSEKKTTKTMTFKNTKRNEN